MDENINIPEEEVFYNTNISEQIFQAIDIIVKKRLEKLNFDQTIEGQIIANDRACFGEYTVKSNGLTFKAYTDYTGYKLYEHIYIRIQQGDYTKQKIITGRVIPEDTEYLLGTPTTVEELFSGDYTGADWDLVDEFQLTNLKEKQPETWGTLEDITHTLDDKTKQDLLKQFLDAAKKETKEHLAYLESNKKSYLKALQQYYYDRGGLTKGDDNVIRFTHSTDTIPSMLTSESTDYVLGRYDSLQDYPSQHDISTLKHIYRSFILPNLKMHTETEE